MAPAPANGLSKSRKATPVASMPPTAATMAGKPAHNKAVVPALPLPYLKRQAATVTVNANANEARTANANANVNAAKEEATPDAALSNSHTQKDDKMRHRDSSDAASADKTADNEINAATSSDGAGSSLTPSQVSSAPNKQLHSPHTEPSSYASTDLAVTAAEKKRAAGHVNGAGAKAPSQPERKNSSVANPASSKASKLRPPPAVSPTRYQMPPPFQPASRLPGMHVNDDASRGPRHHMPNGHAHVHHQGHLSNSSIHLSGFQTSQSSSPAPPHSSGIAPPPGMHFPASRQPFLGPGTNGFPPMMPYGPEMMPVANFDNYGRPSMPYIPPESYPLYRTNFGPSTPHSFHDSHSSMEEINPQQYGARVALHNGGTVVDDAQMQASTNRIYAPPAEFHPRMIPNAAVPPHVMALTDTADDLAGYMQQQFGNPEMSDCSLELRYLDDRAPPVRIPGHRFVLNRSPELATLLRQQTLSPSTLDRFQQTLLIETSSKWIRSDSFYMAGQRLYGMPLLPYPGPRNHHPESGDLSDAGNHVEQLDFALSYAAAGQLLGWAPVTRRGCEVASHLIGWQTIERMLEFALEGHNDLGTHDAYKYGEGSKIILDAVVTFIVHNFPPSFELDAEVVAPVQYARLPVHAPPPAAAKTATEKAADDTPAVQLGKVRRSQRMSNIQFGDLDLSENNPASATVTPKASRSAQPVTHAVLSRILLNIPFAQLKMILESSGSGNVNGWANAESRYRIVRAAVEEREARRVKAVDAVADGRVTDAEMICDGLRAPEPQVLPQWGALGWQEEMLPYGNPDGPSLGRKWAPLPALENVSTAEYP